VSPKIAGMESSAKITLARPMAAITSAIGVNIRLPPPPAAVPAVPVLSAAVPAAVSVVSVPAVRVVSRAPW
jgi:hypothetical protein